MYFITLHEVSEIYKYIIRKHKKISRFLLLSYFLFIFVRVLLKPNI